MTKTKPTLRKRKADSKPQSEFERYIQEIERPEYDGSDIS